MTTGQTVVWDRFKFRGQYYSAREVRERQLQDGELCLLFTPLPLVINIGCDFVHQIVRALDQPSFHILDAGGSVAFVGHAKPDTNVVRFTSLRFLYGQGQIRLHCRTCCEQ